MLETFEEDNDIRRDGDSNERTSNSKVMELDCMDKENNKEENLLEKKTYGKKRHYIIDEYIYIRCNVLFLMILLYSPNKILYY